MTTNTAPDAATHYPAVGSTATSGDQAGTDVSGRPMAPSLYITDITNNPNDRSGDWQWGGQAYAPSDVFGTWKSFTRTVDYTTSTPTVSVSTGIDPAKNYWNLGPGADPVPAGLASEGYGTEVRWNVNDLYAQGILQAGHTYRFYVIVHDGDQNKVGGDCGQASFTYTIPTLSTTPASISGYVRFVQEVVVPVSNAVLALKDANGNFLYDNNNNLITAMTDSSGFYQFTNLPAGTYSVVLINPGTDVLGQAYHYLQAIPGTVGDPTEGTASADGSEIDGISLLPGDVGTEFDFLVKR